MRGMMVLLAIGLIAAADTGRREVTYLGFPGCPNGGCLVPVFDHGYLFDQASPPGQSISVWDNEGQPMYTAELAAPDGIRGHRYSGVAVDTDGTVAVPIAFGDGAFKGGAIILLDRTGKPSRTIDTGRYAPDILAFADDHALWVGGLLFGDTQRETKKDYGIVRKYSPEGRLAGEYLPRLSFPPGLSPAFGGIQCWMEVARDRVGLLTYPGMVGNNPTWVELDLNGKEIGRWAIDPGQARHVRARALTLQGVLYGTEWEKAAKQNRVLVFDHATSSWKATNAEVPGLLMGADGDQLVYWANRAYEPSGEKLVWIDAPKPE